MKYLYLPFSSINQVERGRAEAEEPDSSNLIIICEKWPTSSAATVNWTLCMMLLCRSVCVRACVCVCV